ncbi:MAG: hypothetical protein WCF90_09770 [Methanomicrobiales archaeon]
MRIIRLIIISSCIQTMWDTRANTVHRPMIPNTGISEGVFAATACLKSYLVVIVMITIYYVAWSGIF